MYVCISDSVYVCTKKQLKTKRTNLLKIGPDSYTVCMYMYIYA